MDLEGKNRQERKRQVAISGAWGLVLFATIVAYWPGLSGPFILDDLTSIAQLGNFGSVHNWETFSAFVFGGTAGPTGRPLALLTFLIDGNTWPTDAFPFKRTNLIIHLLNGALLGVLTRQVLMLSDFETKTASWLALVSAATWMLHPFLVSTTLYAVQRMAQLAMLFSVAGIVSYLYSRSFLATNAKKGYFLMTLSLGIFTILATLCKENGVLLPVLIGVLELTIISSRGAVLPALDRRWAITFLALPSVFIVAYLAYGFLSADFIANSQSRDFSLYERVLTQSRVVTNYLQHWFLPKLYTTGVFQDHVVKSTGLFSPVTTALGFLLHAGLIAFAFVKRRKLPLLAFGILFFYASHLLESTTLNLEMYFEHRNYTAVAFLFLPLFVLLRDKIDRRMATMLSVVLLVALTGFTRFSATVWSEYEEMVAASARKAPTSARAQSEYAVILFNQGQYEQSLQVLDLAIERIQSNNPILVINRLIIRCNLRQLALTELEAAAAELATKPYDARYLSFYSNLAQALVEERCPAVELEQLRPLFADMLANPVNAEGESRSLSHIHYLIGYVDVKTGAGSEAARQFHASLDAQPDAGSAMTMAALMATEGYLEEALLLSDRALEYLNVATRGVRLGIKVTESDIREFRATVRAEIGARTD